MIRPSISMYFLQSTRVQKLTRWQEYRLSTIGCCQQSDAIGCTATLRKFMTSTQGKLKSHIFFKDFLKDFLTDAVKYLLGTIVNGMICQFWDALIFWVEFIGVLRHMQQYFSHKCDGTDVQADWRSCSYGRTPNAIDISHCSLTCPSYTDTGPPFLYGDSDTPPHLVACYDTLGIRRTYSRLKPPAASRGALIFSVHFRQNSKNW